MTTTVSVASKGAGGATTLVSHLAGPMLEHLRGAHGPEARLLVVDADPESTATSALTGRDPGLYSKTVSTVLQGHHWLREAAVALDEPQEGISTAVREARAGITLVPNNARTQPFFADVADMILLRDQLQTVPESSGPLRDVALILIDCGAVTSHLAETGLLAADHLVAAATPSRRGEHGVRELRRKLRVMSGRFPQLALGSVVLNRVDRGHPVDLEIAAEFESDLGELLCQPAVPYTASIKRADHAGLPVTSLTPANPALNTTLAELAAVILDRSGALVRT